MSVYFSNFPNTIHTGILSKDITRRAEIADTIINNKFAYLPYVINGDEKPEDVANFYYGNVRYTWLVYYSNQIIDPYFDWPLDSVNFDTYVINKYAEEANTTGYDVITWTQNELITDNIIYYENADGDRITHETYTLDPNIVGGDWTPLRYYDYEVTKNDDKRSIQLVERSYARDAEAQLRDLLNDGIL